MKHSDSRKKKLGGSCAGRHEEILILKLYFVTGAAFSSLIYSWFVGNSETLSSDAPDFFELIKLETHLLLYF